MIRLNAKVFVMGSLGVIKSIRPSALLLGPLISVYDASLYMSPVGPRFRPRSCHRDQLCQVCSRFTDKIIILKDPHLCPAAERKRYAIETNHLGHLPVHRSYLSEIFSEFCNLII